MRYEPSPFDCFPLLFSFRPHLFLEQREKLGEELPPNCVSPSNVPMIPFGDGNKVIKVAQSFAPERRPFMEVVNNLYFYGHSVQLKAHHAKYVHSFGWILSIIRNSGLFDF